MMCEGEVLGVTTKAEKVELEVTQAEPAVKGNTSQSARKKVTVENLDLVLEIWEYAKQEFYHCEVRKTEGHKDIVGNELADALATANHKRFVSLVEEYGISEMFGG